MRNEEGSALLGEARLLIAARCLPAIVSKISRTNGYDQAQRDLAARDALGFADALIAAARAQPTSLLKAMACDVRELPAGWNAE